MTPMTADDFERRYRDDPDPWGYLTRPYERAKYVATLTACGAGPFASALELGGSIGVLSARLAERTDALTTIDAAPTAVVKARARLAGRSRVRVLLGSIPLDLPGGPYDLVVASEILYYLHREALSETLRRLQDAMLPGARLVAVHWRPGGDDRPLDARTVHDALAAEPWLSPLASGGSEDYLLDVWAAHE